MFGLGMTEVFDRLACKFTFCRFQLEVVGPESLEYGPQALHLSFKTAAVADDDVYIAEGTAPLQGCHCGVHYTLKLAWRIN